MWSIATYNFRKQQQLKLSLLQPPIFAPVLLLCQGTTKEKVVKLHSMKTYGASRGTTLLNLFFCNQMKGCGSLLLPAASPVLKEPAVLTELRAGRTSDPIWTSWQRAAFFAFQRPEPYFLGCLACSLAPY